MPSMIEAIDRALYFACQSVSDVIIATGITPVGDITVSGHVLVSDSDENDYLNALSGLTAPTMPVAGVEVEQGEIYDYGGTLYMVRQSHTRTEHDPTTIPNLFVRYQVDAGDALDWVIGEQVYVGTQRLYDTVLYQCLQAHQTNVAIYPSAPGVLGVLWGVVSTTDEWTVGTDYVGDNVAGAGNGDVVSYEGSEYRCLQSHTSIVLWYPTAPGIINVLWVTL